MHTDTWHIFIVNGHRPADLLSVSDNRVSSCARTRLGELTERGWLNRSPLDRLVDRMSGKLMSVYHPTKLLCINSFDTLEIPSSSHPARHRNEHDSTRTGFSAAGGIRRGRIANRSDDAPISCHGPLDTGEKPLRTRRDYFAPPRILPFKSESGRVLSSPPRCLYEQQERTFGTQHS